MTETRIVYAQMMLTVDNVFATSDTRARKDNCEDASSSSFSARMMRVVCLHCEWL